MTILSIISMQQSGIDLKPVFDQYLHYKNLPILEFMVNREGKLACRWQADAKGFNMPVRVKIKGGEYQFIKPTTRFMPVNIEEPPKTILKLIPLIIISGCWWISKYSL